MKPTWHRMDSAAVFQELGSDRSRGLSGPEAARRLGMDGPNELVGKGAISAWSILWEQLTARMVVILIVAAVISAALQDYKDALAILAIVVLNACLGFTQEFKAEKAMAALKKMSVPAVRVRRDGRVLEIASRELVRGDVILLEAGNVVPADARWVASTNARVQESALTGESEPVEKSSEPLADDLPVAERSNMAYLGTIVTYGRGEALVTDTGMQTELGNIATMIGAAGRETTPLQKRLDQLGKQLAWVAIGIVAVVFALGLLRGEGIRVMFLTAVSLAVAAIPEGLPTVVTIALALGAQRMLKRHALIRKLPAVETLGSVTVICSDKTGTLTENRMTVTALSVAGHRVELDPADEARVTHPTLALLLSGSALCNDAVLERAGQDVRTIGDPTEGALLAVAARHGLDKGRLEQIMPRVGEVPFDSDRKRMTTIHRAPAGAAAPSELAAVGDWGPWMQASPYVVFTKGAVDGLLEVSSCVWMDGRAEPINDASRQRIVDATGELAGKGMRVLGLSFRPAAAPSASAAEAERDLIFVGLVGMIDPARPEAKDAVKTCRAAGIHPVMITGDHPLTARYIASQLGITDDDRVMTGRELEPLSPSDLEAAVDTVSVYARVSPAHKLRLVEAFQRRGHHVAMTGDGVNDAPALKKADIGVAMGITGTDVAKEAADMVLLDDNFATIVAAVEEGRVIYDNIRKFIKYLLTTNSAELMVMLLAPFLGMPLPLLPLQILWMNLVTDGPPALALAMEGPERNIMRRPPYRPGQSIVGRGLGHHVVVVGALMTVLALGVGLWYWHRGHENWQTMLFTTLAFAQMANVLAIRSERDFIFRAGLFANRWLVAAILATVLAQLAVVYLPSLQDVFTTRPLSVRDLGLTVVLGIVVFSGVELEKWHSRRRGA